MATAVITAIAHRTARVIVLAATGLAWADGGPQLLLRSAEDDLHRRIEFFAAAGARPLATTSIPSG